MRTICIAAVLLTCFAPSAAQESQDLIFRVLQDEMVRSSARLKLEGKASPYYLEYMITDNDSWQVFASFGAVSGARGGKSRYAWIDLRVGDATLDNTNFAGSSGMGSEWLTVDDDYDALRQGLWLATDATYKQAVEDLEQKKAYLQENQVKDRPDDLAKEEPVVSIAPLGKLQVDKEKWTAIARSVSAVFKDYPRIQKSIVQFQGEMRNQWFLNTEGFKNRRSEGNASFAILAGAQAADGMKISDGELVGAVDAKDLPSEEDLKKAARNVAERMIKLLDAPLMDKEYRGPILLEGQAAAQFFGIVLPPNLGSSNEIVGQGNANAGNAWRELIGQKVAAGFLTVTSDPTAKEFNGTPIAPGPEVDDDGVKVQKINLIEKGVLKTFAMSRIPTRHIKKSNGHSENGKGSVSKLFVHSDKTLAGPRLKDRLIEMGKDETLEHVYIARRLVDNVGAALDPTMVRNAFRSSQGGLFVFPPAQLYKVNVATGAEELVRGARFGKLSLRILRDIDATGDDAKPYLFANASTGGYVTAPSILIKEIEIATPGKETEKAPSYPHPFFEEKK